MTHDLLKNLLIVRVVAYPIVASLSA